MFKAIIVLIFLILNVGCVKLEVKPGSVVADTVGAGKELYNTLKRKRNGEEEREYSHSVISQSEAFDTEKNLQCKEQIKKNIKSSSAVLSKILSDSSDINVLGQVRKLTCTMIVIVKPA